MSTTPPPAGSGIVTTRSGPSPKQIIAGVLAVLAIVFVAQNWDKATVTFLFFSFTARIWILFLVLLVTGGAIGWFARGSFGDRKAQKQA
jgi:uncharacterized integral membrane protein